MPLHTIRTKEYQFSLANAVSHHILTLNWRMKHNDEAFIWISRSRHIATQMYYDYICPLFELLPFSLVGLLDKNVTTLNPESLDQTGSEILYCLSQYYDMIACNLPRTIRTKLGLGEVTSWKEEDWIIKYWCGFYQVLVMSIHLPVGYACYKDHHCSTALAALPSMEEDNSQSLRSWDTETFVQLKAKYFQIIDFYCFPNLGTYSR